MGLFYDTNILIKIVRDKSENEKVRNVINPNQLSEYTSLVNKAEILSIALQNKWGNQKRNRLKKLFDEIAVIDISNEQILENYTNIDAYSQGKHPHLQLLDPSKNMGKNDIWIASTVSTLQLKLITTDKDFDHLQDIFLERVLFNVDEL